MTRKEALITEILQVCKLSNITRAKLTPQDRQAGRNPKKIDMEDVFLALAFCTETELIHIASELYIKIPKDDNQGEI